MLSENWKLEIAGMNFPPNASPPVGRRYSRTFQFSVFSFQFSILFLGALLAPLPLTPPARASDPEMSRPYKLQIVLRFSDHRDLTPVLKDKVERELRDNVRAAFGDLVQVDVKRAHPRLKEVEEKGLGALDSWREVDNAKTHFVLIDYVDNTYYEIRAKQHDGYTGQTSPVIRRERTNSRDFLARKIGFILDEDFGVIGEVTGGSDDNNVEVTLKAAALDPQAKPRVNAGDVFGIVEVLQDRGGNLTAAPLQFALLQAQDTPAKDGTVRCKFFHRYKYKEDEKNKASLPNPRPGSLGFRCIKLGTTKAPLTVRLVEQGSKTLKPLNGYFITVQRQGFGSEQKPEQNATNSDGFTRLLGKDKFYENVAFVTIHNPQKREEILARVPIPIVDDRPVVIALALKKEAATPVEFHQRIWVQRINKRLIEDQGIFKDIAAQAPQQNKFADLLAKARILKVGLDEDIHNFKNERKELEAEINSTPGAANNLAEGDKLIEILEADKGQLEIYIAGLVEREAATNDPVRREHLEKVEQARNLVRDTEFDKAIKLYEEAQVALKDDKLAQELAKLKAAWEIKGPEHEKARDYIYKDWPQFDEERMKEKIERAQKAFEVCKENKDNLTPRKLLRVAIGHSTKLNEILENLNADVNTDQRERQNAAVAANSELAKLIDAVKEYLKKSLESN
jgi:hypothetical protein